MKTQREYRNELELQYDGPIPGNLQAWNDGGAFPGSNPPNTNDVAFFVAAMQRRLERVTEAAGHKRDAGKFFIVAVSLEFGVNGNNSAWELAIHSPILAINNEAPAVALVGSLDDVWEAGKSAWCADFDRVKVRELQAKLDGEG